MSEHKIDGSKLYQLAIGIAYEQCMAPELEPLLLLGGGLMLSEM